MSEIDKVFYSNITRGLIQEKNNLYELLEINPATPLSLNNKLEHYNCGFKPRYDKYYESKKRSKLKVRTVKDIRTIFEKDVYSYLPQDLERQQNILLKKIRRGSTKGYDTKQLARNILKSDNPLSRSAWHMLTNINPEEYIHPIQYVLWNGKCIQVSGSRGGKKKFLCKNDLSKYAEVIKREIKIKKRVISRNQGLLQNSLSVKFKPGPLTQKKYLDDSYQKYHVGCIELVNLPKPGLEIFPTYGCTLEPTITHFLHSLRDINGSVSEKWAHFAVSVLGEVKHSQAVQVNKKSITFDLNYKYDQNRILMRRDVDNTYIDSLCELNLGKECKPTENNSDIMPEIRNIICEMINAVEISLNQDIMYSREDENNIPSNELHLNSSNSNCNKEKTKKKFGELDRLHVTVIRLPGSPEKSSTLVPCDKSFCTLGCVCDSLKCPIRLKRHCGRVDCMFECKCDFTNMKAIDNFNSDCPDLLPGLLNLDDEINSKLSKEEQKFHQTVILSGEKSILLKTRRRNWKAPKKYTDFYKNMCLKTDIKPNQVLTIVATKLNFNNVEPWCMVHNLYKCFCKGKFVYSTDTNTLHDTVITAPIEFKQKPLHSDKLDKSYAVSAGKISNTPSVNKDATLVLSSDNDSSSCTMIDLDMYDSYTCARVKPYEGRKYNDGYYLCTNKKIMQMEKDDLNMQERLMKIISQIENTDKKKKTKENNNLSTDEIVESVMPELSLEKTEHTTLYDEVKSAVHGSPNKSKLISWLEYSYKQYKERCELGLVKLTLQAPKAKKMALYPWEFILSRYKERKNLFLVTKQKPFRIFMAVSRNHPSFTDCIDIDDIRFADLQKYPVTIKNLLTNATDLKDSFCILCGLTYCWELIGSVTKVNDQTTTDFNGEDPNQIIPNHESYTSTFDCSENVELVDKNISLRFLSPERCESSDSSKWFVMNIENDFTEIQFYKRGFFVKYESIINAIDIARRSGKTVRLSSQKCADKSSDSQFGIYAVPNAFEACVFVGPYESDESLGIETVKSITVNKTYKRTRGFWITTKKVDNMKVIDNPMSFMPTKDVERNEIVPLDTDATKNIVSQPMTKNIESNEDAEKIEGHIPTASEKVQIKFVKPIKICKTNGFFHLSSKDLLKSLQHTQQQNIQLPAHHSTKLVLSPLRSISKINPKSVKRINIKVNKSTVKSSILVSDSPNKEINQPSTSGTASSESRSINSGTADLDKTASEKGKDAKQDGSMFVLKPEEINERLIKNRNLLKPNISKRSDSKPVQNDEMVADIENFLRGSVSSNDFNEEVFIISDDEDNTNATSSSDDDKKVWIECKNILNFGWIPGRRDTTNRLSFEFPGFKFSEFYQEQVAFTKINTVLGRKICMTRDMKPEWHVVESEEQLKTKHKMKVTDLNPEFVLTRRGLRHKHDLLKALVHHLQTNEEPTVTETLYNVQKAV